METKKLTLAKETLRRLDDATLEEKAGGVTVTIIGLTLLLDCTSTCFSVCPTMCAGGGLTCGRHCTL